MIGLGGDEGESGREIQISYTETSAVWGVEGGEVSRSNLMCNRKRERDSGGDQIIKKKELVVE